MCGQWPPSWLFRRQVPPSFEFIFSLLAACGAQLAWRCEFGMATVAGVRLLAGEAVEGGRHRERLGGRDSVALPVGGHVDVMCSWQVRTDAVESLPAFVTQDTGVASVDDTEDSVT